MSLLKFWVWRDGSVVRCTGWSFRGSEFNSEQFTILCPLLDCGHTCRQTKHLKKPTPPQNKTTTTKSSKKSKETLRNHNKKFWSFIFLFIFWDKVSQSVGWLQAQWVTGDDLEVIPLSPPSECGSCWYMLPGSVHVVLETEPRASCMSAGHSTKRALVPESKLLGCLSLRA